MTIDVIWATGASDAPAKGYWDQALVADLLVGDLWAPSAAFELVEGCGSAGAVVVVPAGKEGGSVAWLQRQIDPLDWALVMLTSDEEATFPWWELSHPRLSIWVQAPDPTGVARANRYLPMGYATDTLRELDDMKRPGRSLDWCFMGQVTHPRRWAAAEQLRTMAGGLLLETPGFAQGLVRFEYLRIMASSKLAVCPGGPTTPDTFRTWEALEAGALPLADARCGGPDRSGYWPLVLGQEPPFPVVEDWTTLSALVQSELARWPHNASVAGAWYQGYKRALAYDLHDDIAALAGWRPTPSALSELITVVIPTSPIPSHPDLGIIDATLGSLTEAGLMGCEVIITADGVRPEQQHRAPAYEAATYELVQRAQRHFNVLPMVFTGHQHQARMARAALDQVRTPLVLYVEHDTPLTGAIDWLGLCNVLLGGAAYLVRFHHETHVLDEHRHLMVDDQAFRIASVDLWRCAQWSQRPHLARSDYYRRILTEHFELEERWMIEPRMHSVLESAWLDDGVAGWERHRTWLYAPSGSMQRSLHLDGRGEDPKWEDR